MIAHAPDQLRAGENGAGWITPDLIRSTVRVWSARYGRPVTEAEAVTILLAAGRLLEVLTPAAEEEQAR